MKARRRSGKRGPTSASRPSAKAVSVDIAVPQPCADGRPALNARKIATATAAPPNPATRGRANRRRSRSSPRSNSRRASSPMTKKKNVISPLFTHSRSSSATPEPPMWMESVVSQSRSYEEASRFTQTSAATAAPSRTAAPPISVRRNCRSGVSTLRDQAVCPRGSDCALRAPVPGRKPPRPAPLASRCSRRISTNRAADLIRAGVRPEQAAQIVDGVGLARILVRPVAPHAREAKRHAAGVARRRLDAVERDLDDELRADEDGDPTPAGLTGQELRRLPLEHLVRQALEALADHDELARARIAGVEMEHVEEEGDDALGRCLAVDPRDGLLERGGAVVSHPEGLAVEHGPLYGEAPHGRDDPGQDVRDLVEVARVDANLVRSPVDLDAHAVELPLDGGAREAGHGVRHGLGGGGEHRQDRPEQLERDRP